MEFAEQINRFTDCKLILNANLSTMGGYKTVGRAKYFIEPHSVKSLFESVYFCENSGVKYYITANCTNVLFAKFVDGAVISLKGFKGISSDGEFITALCGEPISSVCTYAQKLSLTGLENFCGIPGTVGAAAYMNAGAFGKNFSQVIYEITALKDGKINKYFADQCGFAYRKSRFVNSGEIIISVKMRLKKGIRSDIIKTEKHFISERKKTQPVGRTCGSTFINPRGKKAARLIEDAGLKGLKIGKAFVSLKHANFIMTESGADPTDVYELIKAIKKSVFTTHNVKLKEEIVYIGDFN